MRESVSRNSPVQERKNFSISTETGEQTPPFDTRDAKKNHPLFLPVFHTHFPAKVTQLFVASAFSGNNLCKPSPGLFFCLH